MITSKRAATTTPVTSDRSRPRLPQRSDLLGGLAAALGAILVTAWVMQLWHAAPRIPFTAGGDANSVLAAVKNLLRHDWYYTTNLLGEPFGQRLYDFPAAGDLWNLVTVKTLGVFTGDPSLVVNIFFLATFPAAAVGAYIAMRVLGVQVALATALGIAYSILPYHFQRGEAHLFLSAYFAVPLACAVLIRQIDPRTMVRLPRRGVAIRDTLLSRGTVGALVVTALVAGTGLYYAVFFIVLVVVVGVLGGVRDKSVRPVLSSGLLAALVLTVIVLTNVPSLLYRANHGVNTQVASNRPAIDADYYGLKIANLVLPVTGHRIDALAELKAEALGGPVPSEGTEALGMIGAVGFVGLLATSFLRLSTARRREIDPESDAANDVVGRAAALTITCLVIAVIGGAATVVGVAGFSEFHAWNRISVYVAFFSFAAVGIWLTKLLHRHGRMRRVSLIASALAGVLVLVAAYDQTTPAFTPAYAATSVANGNDRAFVAETAHVLGRSASIFQLPYVPFPEFPPVFGMVDYDHLRGYLHSDTLHWSYGGMKGREAEWQSTWLGQPTETAFAGVALAGFDGLYVDRAGYADKGAELELELRAFLGAPIVESEDARLIMYDLRPLRRRLTESLGSELVRRVRIAVLHPAQIRFGNGFSSEDRDATSSWSGRRARLTLENTSTHPQRVVVSFGLSSLDPGSTVTVKGLGAPVVLATSGDDTQFEREITLAPGISHVRFESDAARHQPTGGEPPDVRFQLFDTRVTPQGLVRLARAAARIA